MNKIITLFLLLLIISACSGHNSVVSNPVTGEKPTPGLFSKDSSKGVSLGDLLDPKAKDDSVNINAFLWRASLNVLSIAPLISTDALGGTIITDWYINKNNKNQRIKITAFIKTSELRSNGIGVKVHIQNFKDGSWSETYTNKDLEIKIEDNILNEARNLRYNLKK